MAEQEQQEQEQQGQPQSQAEDLTAELENLRREKEELLQALADREITSALTEAFYQAGGKRDPNLARLLVNQFLDRVGYQDGAVVVVEGGKPRPDVKLVDLMAQARAGSYSVLFDPIDSVGGSGATGSTFVNQGKRYLRSTDPYKLGRNIDAIASGDVVVDL